MNATNFVTEPIPTDSVRGLPVHKLRLKSSTVEVHGAFVSLTLSCLMS